MNNAIFSVLLVLIVSFVAFAIGVLINPIRRQKRAADAETTPEPRRNVSARIVDGRPCIIRTQPDQDDEFWLESIHLPEERAAQIRAGWTTHISIREVRPDGTTGLPLGMALPHKNGLFALHEPLRVDMPITLIHYQEGDALVLTGEALLFGYLKSSDE